MTVLEEKASRKSKNRSSEVKKKKRNTSKSKNVCETERNESYQMEKEMNLLLF